jgi:hypothetical protein
MKKNTHKIPESICTDLLNSIKLLRSEIGDIPVDLLEAQSLIDRKQEWFDPKRFLEIFPTIKLRPGYTLSFFYTNGTGDGRPILYTRKIDQKPLTQKEMDNMLHHMKQTSGLIKHLEFERSIMGYFHFAVLNIIVHQFYLYWHSNYMNSIFVFSNYFLTDLLDFMKVDKQLAQSLSTSIITEPRVTMLGEHKAQVILPMFSGWTGIFYNKIIIEWPCSIESSKKEILQSYESEIRF